MSKELFIELEYDVEKNETNVNTNVKQSLIEELLTDWIRATQMGKGKDEGKPNERDVYNIRIGIDLSDDSFSTRSDTGNVSLTCGIVINYLKSLNEGGNQNGL